MTLASDPKVSNQPSVGIGDVLNGIFQIKRFLAAGGMGEVFEAVNVNTDEVVAVKIMRSDFASNPVVEAMFRNEARILTKLAHPALVKYRVLAREPSLDLLYIVMDFIDGAPLSHQISSIGATTSEQIGLIRRLASGLREAHKLAIIHGDLSPDNIILERGRLERARIVDFGIANSLDPRERLMLPGFSGKIGLAAPEQLGDFGGQIGPWTDVYGLGLLALSLSLGRTYNFGNVAEEAIGRRHEPIDLSLVQPELRPLLQAMLVPDPAARLRSMDAVLETVDDTNFQKTLFALPGAAFLPAGQATVPEAPVQERPVSLVQQLTEASAVAEKAKSLKRQLVMAGSAAVLIGGGWWYYSVVNAQENNLAAAKTALASENCAWLTVETGTDAKKSKTLIVRGAANDPAAIRATIMSATGGKSTVDMLGVGQLDPAACTLVDTIRPMRSDKNLIVTAESNYKMRPDGAPSLPGKMGVRTIETIDIGGGGIPFSLYALSPKGDLNFIMDRSSLPAMVKAGKVEMIGAEMARFKFDIGYEGWTGLLVVEGQDQTNNKLWTVSPQSRDKAWFNQLASEASKHGWQADMVWFSTSISGKG